MLVILCQISELKRNEIVTGYARMSTALVVPLVFSEHITPDESAGIYRHLECPAAYID